MNKPDNHIDERKDGDSLGLQLRLLYNRAYDEGYYKGRHSEQYDTNTPDKTEHVATAYKAIDQYYADFYRNKIPENMALSEILDNFAEAISSPDYDFETDPAGVQEHYDNERKYTIAAIVNYFMNKLPKKQPDYRGMNSVDGMTNTVLRRQKSINYGYNQAIDDITAQFNSRGDNDD